ncbi:MAG TPA: DUF4249 domain-containing protein [Bacteroidales bacterium]|nr:DUF4249 domain-containing protein [Bacteroidales bacterium]
MKQIIYILFFTLFFTACEKEISVDLPPYNSKLVIEGYIEQGANPYVLITKSQGYFDPVDSNTFQEMQVTNAKVYVSNGTETDTLVNIGPYYFGNKFIGEVGKQYDLTVWVDDKKYTATTTILAPVPIDSIKFYPDPDSDVDTLGFLWLYAHDPDTMGNAYRIFTKTLGKDTRFVHPFIATMNDELFNGQPVEFSIYRGKDEFQNDLYDEEGLDSLGIKWYYFVMGESIVVKFCTIDYANFVFWETVERQQQSEGNPFAAPVTPKSNIQGEALGIWGGYGVFLDTVDISPDIIKK